MELHIENRNYSNYDWKPIVENSGYEDIQEKCPNPIEHKIFHGSVFNPDTGVLIPSPHIMESKKLPGILILEGNKTYGRQIKKTGKGKGRLYYRCIPNNKHLPVFLIPYEPPMDFSKHQLNLFVLFEYKEWTSNHAPYGNLTETIGKVSDLSAYYEYLLYCRGMHFSHQTAINQKIRIHVNDFVKKNEKKTEMEFGIKFDTKLFQTKKENQIPFIFSIDPIGSKDLDDAFSIHTNQEGNVIIRIYISDMVYWIEQFHLWEDLRLEKIGANTLYLPGRNRVMVPGILSDQKASLLADGELKPVIVYEIEFSSNSCGTVIGNRFYRDQVFINANYRYDTDILEKSENYHKMFDFTRKWVSQQSSGNSGGSGGDNSSGDSGYENNIQDSHELVSYWMVEYNRTVGKELSEIGKGIYRVCTHKHKIPDTNHEKTGKENQECKKIMQFWKSDVKGEYAFYSSNQGDMVHYGMGENGIYYYTHCSSPIRRLVDIYNQSCLINKMDSGLFIAVRQEIKEFQNVMEKQETMVELNRQTSESKRVQTECEMLATFFSCQDISENTYEGTVIDVDIKGAWVYLHFWKRIVFVKYSTDLNGGGHENIMIGNIEKCQIFLFEEEEKANRKIVVRFVSYLLSSPSSSSSSFSS
jgi:exoribonuclease R